MGVTFLLGLSSNERGSAQVKLLQTMALISCNDEAWRDRLQEALERKEFVHLLDLDYASNGAFCENAAKEHSAVFVFVARDRHGYFSRPGATNYDGQSKRVR